MSNITLSVFSADETGGNPCTIVQGRRTGDEMIDLAKTEGHECCLAIREGSNAIKLRFFAPSGEMDMCAHAAAAAAWLLAEPKGAIFRLECAGGILRAFKSPDEIVSISQPAGRIERVQPEAALVALGLARSDLIAGRAVVNGATTRSKTLVPLASFSTLQSLSPDPDDVRVACDVLGSTGLYPWTEIAPGQVDARQFPRSAGYAEDPATGVAAAALFFDLGAPADGLTVYQGRAMKRASKIVVHRDPEGDGCLLSGRVRRTGPNENSRISRPRRQQRH